MSYIRFLATIRDMREIANTPPGTPGMATKAQVAEWLASIEELTMDDMLRLVGDLHETMKRPKEGK